jgi:hypothetical protein
MELKEVVHDLWERYDQAAEVERAACGGEPDLLVVAKEETN